MTGQRDEMAGVIRSVTDTWDEPLDEVHDVPQIVNALLAAGFGPVRAVETERDALAAAYATAPSCEARQTCRTLARAESAEAALTGLRAGVEALADEHEAVMDAIVPMPNLAERDSGRRTVRALRTLACSPDCEEES